MTTMDTADYTVEEYFARNNVREKVSFGGILGRGVIAIVRSRFGFRDGPHVEDERVYGILSDGRGFSDTITDDNLTQTPRLNSGEGK